MPVAPRDIRASDVSDAWLKSVELLDSLPGKHAYQHTVHIERPTVDNHRVRTVVDEMFADLIHTNSKLQPVNTVRNTIFPAAWARNRAPSELAEYYRSQYDYLREYPANRDGTYFGRMVALPTDDDARPIDQLNLIVEKLQAQGNHWKTRYEADLSDTAMQIHSKRGNDQRVVMGFPCLSFCSFQREDDTLHMVANYRNHYIRERAYGNYLGLGQLLGYIARYTDMTPGCLTVIAGHAAIESTAPRVRAAAAEGRRAYDH